MRVTVAGVVFTDAPDVDDDRVFLITPKGLSGWFGSAGVRRQETQRPAGHGSFDSLGYRDAKVPFIRGTVIARTRGELNAMSRQLEGLLADGSMARMTVQDDVGGVTWQDVRIAQPAVVDDFGDGETADFQVGFWSPKAEIYGDGDPKRATGSSATLFHRGTIPAPITVRIPNSPAAYTISGPGGRQFVVSGAPSGGVHVVDLRTGRVTRDGVLLQGVVTRADSWDLPSGVRWAHSISAGSPDWLVPDTYA